MVLRNLLLLFLVANVATAFWPFSASENIENDAVNFSEEELDALSDDMSEDEDLDLDSTFETNPRYFRKCFNEYSCEACMRIKKAKQCYRFMNKCYMTCSGCKAAPQKDYFPTKKCLLFKQKGWCHKYRALRLKCRKTCGSCSVDGDWSAWGTWNTCSKTCANGTQSRTRQCNSPAPQFGGRPCKGNPSENRECYQNVSCPIDGEWGEWSKWNMCSKTCRQGRQLRSRECNSPSPQFGGKECKGLSNQTRPCNMNVSCPVDGDWSAWGTWNTCSKTCANGTQSRTRQCDSPAPQFGGKPCKGNPSENRVCNQNVSCPIDGSWGHWNSWSACSKTCKYGRQSRSRECNSPAPQFGGKQCEEESNQTRICNGNVSCPVDGSWSNWEPWNACTKTCGGGKQFRTRQCTNPAPSDGGRQCDGPFTQSRDCNKEQCAVDGEWGEWSKWNMCSKTCRQGIQLRSRECNSPSPQFGGKECKGLSNQTRPCNMNVSCPVDGDWSAWGTWNTCSKTCANGTQSRTRQCDSPAPQFGGKPCKGNPSENRVCNQNVSCPIDGSWGHWNSWSACSKTCKYGRQSRSRECNSPAPQFGGKQCEEESNQTRICNGNVSCPVDGSWSNWEPWNACTKTCGGGKQFRTRQCTNPAPSDGGRQCDGPFTQSRDCNKEQCAVDGEWGEWSKWNMCSKTCRQGIQLRSRECNSPSPQFGGKECKGLSNQTRPCNMNVSCPVDGDWSAWGTWNTCSKTCANGTQSRIRQCDSPAPQFGGKPCKGNPSENRECNQNVSCPIDGSWGHWNAWSACSKTCKYGRQSRSRECNSPAPQFGGKQCEEESNQTRICNGNVSCPVDGSWSNWEPWNACTKTCGGGKQFRARQCTNPAPSDGGKQCDGPFSQSRDCNKEQCAVNGNWGEWESWNECSKTCGGGIQSRSRQCNNPAPAFGGETCVGSFTQSRVCNKDDCPVDGQWGSWMSWSACSKTCGQGIQQRKRDCDQPKPANNGKQCVGEAYEGRSCDVYYPCPIDGGWTEWGSWTPCSKSCGVGYRARTRSCTNPPAQNEGRGCTGKNSQIQVCEIEKSCY